jgi:conjugative relaxase-like TrwC/TraI family protein
MSLGTGYEYLLSSVARGDGAVGSSSPLTRYYAESGTPPGRFLGAGLSGLRDGAGIAEGTAVTERMLFNLLGMLADPITGRPLGNRPQQWPASRAERVRMRVGHLPTNLATSVRADTIARIEAEESERERSIRRPVAGFDLTFSVPKSVSTVWAVADAETQASIYLAHQDAICVALRYAEEHIFFSRSGAGGVVQESIRGVVAAAFDHWDSRSGDPHLHSHVVVANRVQTLDGLWRTLDSKTLHKYVVALSELHEGVLQDLVTQRLGYAWEERARRHSAAPRWDIGGVPDNLLEHFSRRSVDIEAATSMLISEYARAHGRQPSNAQVLQLRQQATLQTRPDKQRHTLTEQTATWRERARPFVCGDTGAWADGLRGRSLLPALRVETIDDSMLQEASRVTLAVVASKRATFTHANVLAEAHRQLHGVRFGSPDDRIATADRLTSIALREAVMLTAPKCLTAGAQIFSTRDILDAESRMLEAGRNIDGPTATPSTPSTFGEDQAAAVHAIATSGRMLDVLVGPAGSGKTTSLASLRETWESEHGNGSVIALAPSAAAAEVLADELGIETENTAKWIHEANRQDERLDRMAELIDRIDTLGSTSTKLARRLRVQLDEAYTEYERWTMRRKQLVIVDEAGLAGTLALDRIVTEAREVGAKVLLVGDWAQLTAIEAGGAFAMLVNDRGDAPELTTVRRFLNGWERDASLLLRVGNEAAVDAYKQHGRIRSGNAEEMLDAVYNGWRGDTAKGLESLMIAVDYESVAELNLRARADRVDAGEVESRCIAISGGGVAGVGDRVITRQNDRTLRAGRGWVKNGDVWVVRTVHPDGSLTLRRDQAKGEIMLDSDYTRRHLELGYAATAHRSQGRTVDTAHALVSSTNTRELLYVSTTRGRAANIIYVDTCVDPDEDTNHGYGTQGCAEDILRRVLQRSGADTSAHSHLERYETGVDDWLAIHRAASATRRSILGADVTQARVDSHTSIARSL